MGAVCLINGDGIVFKVKSYMNSKSWKCMRMINRSG